MIRKLHFTLILLILLTLLIPTGFALDLNETSDEIAIDYDSSDVLSANEVYFNSTVENDGDGSHNNPYKYVTPSRITSNSILYFANGEYSLSTSKSIFSMTMIGEDAEKTIFTGNGDLFSVSGTLTLQNMTFINSTLTNHGTIRATNVIFSGGVADSVDEYDNSFGGTIFNDGDYYYPYLYLTNCTIRNSYAVYGGAIYMGGGSATITDSRFVNNAAFMYGGAIACEQTSTLTVTNSIFDSDYSIHNAGGAIYGVDSLLNIKDSQFINCNATFGGAICDLTSKSTFVNITASSNRAKYQGGAIYKMYGSISITNSYFNSNVAQDGGALFIDNSTSFTLTHSTLTSNIAYTCGGALYSFSNNKTVISSNNIIKNSARSHPNTYETDKLNLNIGNGNYTMYVYDDSNFNGTLPEKFDLRDYGWITSVKDQETSGNCWAFSALAALESCILKASNTTLDLSEENVKNLIEWYSDYGWASETNGGGNEYMSFGYLVSWMGPVFEDDDLTDDYTLVSPLLNSMIHVQNIVCLPRSSYTDNDGIKEALMKYGAVSTALYYSSTYLNSRTKGYYYDGSDGEYANHAVTIVGWDDGYSRYNYKYTAPGNGAWIVKNSWGSSWGNDGYFYVSYYDAKFAEVGDPIGGYTFILNDTQRFDKNYQYDIIGATDFFVTGKDTIWYENLFNATGNELLTAFSTYFNITTSWEAYIYVNDVLKLTQSGLSECGYYTFNLDEFIPLKEGDEFKIAIRINASKFASFPVSECIRQNRISYYPGVSFFSYDGKTWYDLYDYKMSGYDHIYESQVACIKAFTTLGELSSTINLNNAVNSSEVLKDIDLIGNITDQYGNLVSDGILTIVYENTTKTLNVNNGLINTTISFNSIGNHSVCLTFTSDYYISSNKTFNISIVKSDVILDISINNITYSQDLIANITLTSLNGELIDDELLLIINNKTYAVNSNQIFNITDKLDTGDYSALVLFNGSNRFIASNASCSFTILPIELDISLDIIQDFDNVLLIINSSEPLIVPVKINNETFEVNCSDVGILNLTDLDLGNYLVNITIELDNHYPVSITDSFNVSSIDTSINASDVLMFYKDGTRFRVNLTDIDGNPLTNRTLIININNVNYTVTTNANASASIAINLDSGNYTVNVFYLGEKKYNPSNITRNVTILSTIVAKDVVKYFRNGTQFYALILDSQGNPLSKTSVLMNINGVFYNRTTNESGIVKLNINLHAGEYILTVTNPLTNEMQSSKITVLSKFTENYDIVKYFRNATQYTLKVVGDEGEPLAGRTVKFNINGVFYYRVTNESGFAKLNINLNPGNYIITAEYGDCRVSNNITVLSVIETEDMEMNHGDGSRFKALILDGQGNPYPNQEVIFNINGVFYNRFTNSTGFANLNINLMRGKYIITTSYNGLNSANTIIIH
ncbi:C1 family peptidase [Methanobrevibacter sp.]|uniref:C1 family peptidase n=1 Tax=Methanobrevibacter sp. TaxID=66852 RepID=UPI00388E2A75